MGIFLALCTFAQNEVDVATLGKQQYQQVKQLQEVNEAKALKTGDAPERSACWWIAVHSKS